MDTKKASAPWVIALVHYLIAGFAIPFVGGFLIGIAFGIAQINVGDGPLSGLFMAPLSLMLIYFGVVYSSRYIQKKYQYSDAQQIVNLSTIYLAAVRLIFTALGVAVLVAVGAPQVPALPMILSVGLVQAILEIAVFYFFSKQQLVDMAAFTPEVPPPQPPVPPQA